MSKEYSEWLQNVVDEELSQELWSMKNDERKKEECFYKSLEFGTGGLRGILGAGSNRMNIHTVSRATYGLAAYVKERKQEAAVVIAYDTRNKSREFAHLSADIFSSFGVKSYIFDSPTPTPVLSFAVRRLRADAGVVITASHNPKEYNGYKVYNEKGCQITDTAAAAITEKIEKYGYFEICIPRKEIIYRIGEEILEAFLDEIEKYRYARDKKELFPSIVYTPLHGTGYIPVKKLFERMGVSDYAVVSEQAEENGDFPTCPYPNPEEKAALKLAVELAKKRGSDLVLATDPDADRVGVVVKEGMRYRFLTGNEIGILLENYLLFKRSEKGELSENSLVVKTIVTTDLAEKIAKDYGAKVEEVLTGFKYIGERIDELKRKDDYVLGLEESCGYLIGTHARDKDAVSAIMLIVEMAAYYKGNGQSLCSALEKLYEKYGYYVSLLRSFHFEGAKGKQDLEHLIDTLREAPLETIAGEKVLSRADYLKGVNGLPKSNVLSFVSKNNKVVIRPSGTEPKLKIYFSARADNQAEAERNIGALEKDVKQKLGL